jgi:ABC-type polysaccharide/polyol phosphate export permease
MKGFSYVARAVAWRSIRGMFSSPALLLPTVIPPLFVLIAFAGGLSKLSGVRDFGYPLGYTAFIFVFASLQFLAPVYVPVGLLTGWIHDIARINPATPVLEAGRGLLAGTPADLALSFSILAAGIAVTGIWARRGLSSAERAG